MKITIELETTNKANLEEVANFIAKLISETTHKRTETAQKSTKAPQPIPEVTPEVKTPSELTGTSLEELKNIAKLAVEKSDRLVVKTIISKYADKLAEVKEADYTKLFEELSKVGA